MNPNDRGTKKWTSLMMPEHIEMLQEVWKEDEKEKKAILDEQQIEENVFALHCAMKDGLPVKIKHHNGVNYSCSTVKVVNMNQSTKKISCKDYKNKEDITIQFDDIYDVSVL
ncbi:YolD-like family protein [Halobacillus seohaensis]|uniref:YolD-like family protein n=1 Tax=Halobacillus seohaensis TaxID=447421 RepID=A0ABW2EF50_9BACI